MQLNKEQLITAKKIRDIIIKHYPKCFFKQNPKPLKKRIHIDLFALQEQYPDIIVSKVVLKRAVCVYVCSPEYTKALCAEGAMRIDLDGVEIEPVSEKDRKHAVKRPPKLIVKDSKTNEPINNKDVQGTQGASQPEISAPKSKDVKVKKIVLKRETLSLKSNNSQVKQVMVKRKRCAPWRGKAEGA